MRHVLRMLAIGLTALAAAASGALALLQTDAGLRAAAGLAARFAGGPVARIEIAGAEGFVPFRFALNGLAFSDRGGRWLAADRVEIAWRPTALLAGRLHVERLAVAGATVARLPAEDRAPAAAGPPDLAMPQPPLAILVDALSWEAVTIEAPVAGERLKSSGTASARLTRERLGLAVAAEARRDGGSAARLEALVEADPADGSLTLRATAREPAGGVLAGLLGLPDRPPLALALTGSGTLAGWRGRLSGGFGEGAAVDLGLRLALVRQRLAVEVAGEVAAGRVMPTGLSAALGPRLAVDAAVAIDGRTLAVERATVTALPGELRISGAVDLARGHPDLAATTPRLDLSALRALVDLPLDGTLTAEGRLEGDALALEATLHGLSGLPVELPPVLLDRIEASLGGTIETDGLRLDRLRLASGPVAVTGDGRLAGERLEARLRAQISDLAALGALVPLSPSGGLDIDAAVTGDLAGRGLEVVAGFAGVRLATGAAALDALLGPAPQAAVALALDEGGLQVRSLTVDGAATTLSGDAMLAPDEAISGRLSAVLPRLAALDAALGASLAGSLALSADLSGTVAAPRATLAATATGLRGFDLATDRIAVGAGVALDGTRLAAEVALETAAIAGAADVPPLAGHTRLVLDGERLVLSDLSLEAGGARLAGPLTVNLADRTATGSLEVDVPTLGAFLPELAGRVHARASLASVRGRQDATLHLRGEGLAMQDGPAADADVEIVLEGEVGRVSLKAEGRGEPHRSLATGGRFSIAEEAMSLTLSRLTATAHGIEAVLAAPLTIEQAGEGARLRDLDLRIADGRLRGGGVLAPGGSDFAVTLDDLPVAAIRRIVPGAPLSGIVSARLAIQGTAAAPVATLHVEAPEIKAVRGDLGDLRPGRLAVSARWAAGRLEVKGDAGIPGEGELDLSLAMPLPAGEGGLPRLDEAAPITGTLSGRADLARIAAFALPVADRLEGRLDIDLRMSGSAGEPRLEGAARATDVLYENLASGVIVQVPTLSLRGDNDRLVIASEGANDGLDGTLELNGLVAIGEAGALGYELTATLARFHVVRLDLVTARASGELRMAGDTDGARVSGALTVDEAEVRIAESLPPSVVTLPVVEINDGRDGPAPEEDEPWPLALDLEIDAPHNMFVRGRGVESVWRGHVVVTGTASEPRLDGRLTMVRGELNTLDRKFVFRRGLVTFEPRQEIDPAIDLMAEVEAGDILARIMVGGTASAPAIELASEPPLPREDILARILFGTPSARLSAVQAIRLAAAAATLSGRGGSGGVVDTLRRSLDLDLLTVETTPDVSAPAAGASLSAGKYVADGVLLKVEQGLTPGSSRAVIEVEITPEISVETDYGADSRGRFGVNWKVDY